MRLANLKSRNEVGLDFVIRSLNLNTPFGTKALKSLSPFMPGEENELNLELDKTDFFLNIIDRNKKTLNVIIQEMMEVKDLTFSIERSLNNVLSIVELYELKNLLLRMDKIKKTMDSLEVDLPIEFHLEDVSMLLDILDPRGDRINTFYIYDEFSTKLNPLRTRKRELEVKIRKGLKFQKKILEEKYPLNFNPKFECSIQKSNEKIIEIARKIPEIIINYQDYMTETYTIKPNEEICQMNMEIQNLEEELEKLEIEIREELSQNIGKLRQMLNRNCEKIGQIDFALAKAIYAKDNGCVRPIVTNEHIIEFENGRHLEVEKILNSKDKKYCPVSMKLNEGVSCITGANMGGKTVCLKLAGLVAILCQYGFFVPCSMAKVGLSSSIHILIGDSQSLERGLSSFGSEMEELKEILGGSKDRAFILIDEIASGTNPSEGFALTKSVIEYLSKRNYISLITTHFDGVNETEKSQNMQVVGLANVDFDKLDKEIRYANRKERIEIIGKYMDYSLMKLGNNQMVSKDAINIAKMLGINEEIINNAKEYM